MMVACLAAVVALFVPAAVQPEAQTTLRVTVQQAKDAFEGFVDTEWSDNHLSDGTIETSATSDSTTISLRHLSNELAQILLVVGENRPRRGAIIVDALMFAGLPDASKWFANSVYLLSAAFGLRSLCF